MEMEKKKKSLLWVTYFLLLGNSILVSYRFPDVHASGRTAWASWLNFLIPRTQACQCCGCSHMHSQFVCHSWWSDVIPKMHLFVKGVLAWAGLLQSENKTHMNQRCKRLLTLLVGYFKRALLFVPGDQIPGKFLCLCVVRSCTKTWYTLRGKSFSVGVLRSPLGSGGLGMQLKPSCLEPCGEGTGTGTEDQVI